MASSKEPTPGTMTPPAAAMVAGSSEMTALPPASLMERATLERLPLW